VRSLSYVCPDYSRYLINLTDRGGHDDFSGEVVSDALQMTERFSRVIGFATFWTHFGLDRDEKPIAPEPNLSLNRRFLDASSLADYTPHDALLRLNSGSHRVGSG
jgi:hypothetical protein